jgi:hypothetical protein
MRLGLNQPVTLKARRYIACGLFLCGQPNLQDGLLDGQLNQAAVDRPEVAVTSRQSL